jgi:hypothetical protein
MDVDGPVLVLADSITIRRSRVRGYILINWGNAGLSGIVLEDTEVDGGNARAGCAIGNRDYSARRCNVHGATRGLRADGDTHVEDCYIHGIWEAAGGGNNGVVSTGGARTIIRHNTIESSATSNGAVFLQALSDPLNDVLVEDNVLNGGGYALYLRKGDSTAVVNTRVINNRFGRMFFDRGGYWGPLSIDADCEFRGNIWDETGEPLSR